MPKTKRVPHDYSIYLFKIFTFEHEITVLKNTVNNMSFMYASVFLIEDLVNNDSTLKLSKIFSGLMVALDNFSTVFEAIDIEACLSCVFLQD